MHEHCIVIGRQQDIGRTDRTKVAGLAGGLPVLDKSHQTGDMTVLCAVDQLVYDISLSKTKMRVSDRLIVNDHRHRSLVFQLDADRFSRKLTEISLFCRNRSSKKHCRNSCCRHQAEDF